MSTRFIHSSVVSKKALFFLLNGAFFECNYISIAISICTLFYIFIRGSIFSNFSFETMTTSLASSRAAKSFSNC